MTRELSLSVHYGVALVGKLEGTQAGRMNFRYAEHWLQTPGRFPISISMPLGKTLYTDIAHNWFANLLPEERQRRRVAQRLGIDEAYDFGLLRALGGECAGALSITEGELPEVPVARLEPISEADLKRWIANPSDLPIVDDQREMRLSLAGAQEKLPVVVKSGDLFLPAGGSPSTHILKLPQRDFSQLPENEYFITKLAANFGLPTHAISLRRVGKTYVSLAQRYDRTSSADGSIRRLHQEDFCQATGIPAFKKYEHDGGPSLATCINLAAKELPHPVLAVERLLRWVIFNVLTGTSDAHAKNLSFLRLQDGSLVLAPFYDLVCTRAYPGLSRSLAMRIGDDFDPGKISAKHWHMLALAIGVSPKTVLGEVGSACERLEALFDATLSTIRDEGVAFTKATDLKKVLTKQLRVMRAASPVIKTSKT